MSRGRVPGDAELATLLAPLPSAALGVMATVYACADAPDRPRLLQQLLQVALALEVPRTTLALVYARVLRDAPFVLTLNVSSLAAAIPNPHNCSVLRWSRPHVASLTTHCPKCKHALTQWRCFDTNFLTFAEGLRQVVIVFLRCDACSIVTGGPWIWKDVPREARHRLHEFPCGHSHVYCASLGSLCFARHPRWFFAVPFLVVETTLLHFFERSLLHGGMTLTAFHAAYMA